MATGSSKSLCYQLPAKCTTGSTVVIGPLSVLMDDQMHGLQARGISCAKYDSSVDQEGRAALLRQLGSTLKILYTTPEQFSVSSMLRTRLGHSAVTDLLPSQVPCTTVDCSERACPGEQIA